LPDSLHSDSQGDSEYRAENPEFGATFTYYLRDGVKSAKDKREDAEKVAKEKGEDSLYPEWNQLESELREAEPTVYLLIKNSDGNIIRRVDAEAKKGLHRVSWDLRFPSANALGTNAGFFGDTGPLVAPGGYSASLYATVAGKSRALAESVNFEVKPIYQETVPGGVTPEQRTASLLQIENLRGRVSAASSQINDLKAQLSSYRMAMDRSPAVAGELESVYNRLRQAVFVAEEVLIGQSSRQGMGASPANVTSRLFMIEFARANTWGLTDTQKQQIVYVQDSLEKLQPQLNQMRQVEFPAFRQSLLEAGAPWMPQGLMKEISEERVEID
jgi:hypothetical protein